MSILLALLLVLGPALLGTFTRSVWMFLLLLALNVWQVVALMNDPERISTTMIITLPALYLLAIALVIIGRWRVRRMRDREIAEEQLAELRRQNELLERRWPR